MKNDKDVKEQVKDTIRENSWWTEWAGRIGYAAKGFVYIVVGILAISGAAGNQNVDVGSHSALKSIVELPFGQILLIIVTVGLICHAIWRIIQAFMDTDNEGSDTKSYLKRTAFFTIGLIYFGLAFSAVKIILGVTNQSQFWAKSWTASILSQPFGRWIAALIGATIIGIGLYQLFQAYTTKFRENLLSTLNEDVEKIGIYLGKFGYTARGIVFFLIGGFLIFAAWSSNAGKTKDLGDALYFVERQPYGLWLLIIIAVGLISYGVFMIFLASYRDMVSD